jgi:hypothetical protein
VPEGSPAGIGAGKLRGERTRKKEMESGFAPTLTAEETRRKGLRGHEDAHPEGPRLLHQGDERALGRLRAEPRAPGCRGSGPPCSGLPARNRRGSRGSWGLPVSKSGGKEGTARERRWLVVATGGGWWSRSSPNAPLTCALVVGGRSC